MDAPLPPEIDDALRHLIAQTARIIGPSLVGIFLEGSYAWGDPIETSDLDLRIVVDGPLPQDLVAAVYDDCRLRNAYRLPEEPAGRAALTALCDRAVAFENRFMAESIPLLRGLVANGSEKLKAGARRRLSEIGQPPET